MCVCVREREREKERCVHVCVHVCACVHVSDREGERASSCYQVIFSKVEINTMKLSCVSTPEHNFPQTKYIASLFSSLYDKS